MLESIQGMSDKYFRRCKLFTFKKAAREQAAIKKRQKSQNVSLLPNDWQHTLTSRTRSCAGSNFLRILLKNKNKQICQLNKTQEKDSQSKTGRGKKVQLEEEKVNEAEDTTLHITCVRSFSKDGTEEELIVQLGFFP